MVRLYILLVICAVLLLSSCSGQVNTLEVDPSTTVTSSVLMEEEKGVSQSVYLSFEERVDRYGESGCVIYNNYSDTIPQNMELFEAWLDAYLSRQSATVALVLDGRPFPSQTLMLACNGTEEYTVIKDDGTIYNSSFILKREFDYVFASEYEELNYCNILLYKNFDAFGTSLSFDGQDLGSTSVADAHSIATAFITETGLNPKDSNYINEMYGAVQLYNHPCYIIRSFNEENPISSSKFLAINADGGSLIFLQDGMDGSWVLQKDNQAQQLKPPLI